MMIPRITIVALNPLQGNARSVLPYISLQKALTSEPFTASGHFPSSLSWTLVGFPFPFFLGLMLRFVLFRGLLSISVPASDFLLDDVESLR